MRVRTFLRESVEGVGGCGVGGEEVVAALDVVVVFDAPPLGPDCGFDAVSLADEEVPAENLGEAVHHIVELVVLHVHQRAHRESQLRYLRRRVVADSVRLEQLLQLSGSSHRVARRRRYSCRRRGHRVIEERAQRGAGGGGRRGEDGAWVPLE